MNNSSKVKIGLVVGSTNWLPEQYAIKKRNELFEAYCKKYGNESLYECQICINDNEINIKRVLKELRKAECNALCICFANYGPETCGSLLVNEFDGPVMMFGAKDEDSKLYETRLDSLSGFINACYALKLHSANALIPNNPIMNVEESIEEIHKFESIAKAYIGINDLKIISIGPRPNSYLASYASNIPLYKIGIEVSEFSELELFNSYNKHEGDTRIESLVGEMKQEINQDFNLEVLEKLARYEITIEDWIRNYKGKNNNVCLTSTCWPAFPVSFGFVPCYVNSRLTAKGIPVSCEVDIYGALSEYIGQCVSNDSVTILNINNNLPDVIYEKQIKGIRFNGETFNNSDLFVGYHCGVTCSNKLIDSKLKNHFVNNQLIGEEKSKGTIQGRIVDGPVTLFRIQPTLSGELEAYIVQGQVLPIKLDTYGGYGVIGIQEMGRFIRNVIIEKGFPNHTTVIFGHFGSELVSLMKILGVKKIYYNHPHDVPYENENIFN